MTIENSNTAQPRFAIIGGSGLAQLPDLENAQTLAIDTPFGKVDDLCVGCLEGCKVAFLPRHGREHATPPHRINYRANVYALKLIGVNRVLAVNAVGGISESMSPDTLVLPDQLIDYTYGREHTYFSGSEMIDLDGRGRDGVGVKDGVKDGVKTGVEHIEFTDPFDMDWRRQIEQIARAIGLDMVSGATVACTQGPRLETAAEIRRIQRDGGDIVGMTTMPEAALARELRLRYASLAIVVNWAAGLGDEEITLQAIYQVLTQAIVRVKPLFYAMAKHENADV